MIKYHGVAPEASLRDVIALLTTDTRTEVTVAEVHVDAAADVSAVKLQAQHCPEDSSASNVAIDTRSTASAELSSSVKETVEDILSSVVSQELNDAASTVNQ
ncbi:hypothetical protein AAVH_18123 [Aphelenchoides avenae]|nr:hypothetical protein AAVH_18123 [Aphelenchus avenae]